jgi:hypothetical protein
MACLVEEQEEASEMEETEKTSVDLAMAATSVIGLTNKAAAHWTQKIYNRKLHKTGILDTGATSGAAPEEDEDCFVDTGIPSTKIFIFPDKRMNKAIKKDAHEAQSLQECKRNEHNARTTFDTHQRPQTSGSRLHDGVH